MTVVDLLNALKALCEDEVKNMILPTAVQNGDKKRIVRAPEFYLQRLPKSENAKKLAPYCIIQAIHTKHIQNPGSRPLFSVEVRFIFCVYGENEQEGAIMLLNFMERVQQQLLKKISIKNAGLLNVTEPLETFVYPDDTAPYFAGEMVGTFILPAIEREVDLHGYQSQIGNRKTVGRFGDGRFEDEQS